MGVNHAPSVRLCRYSTMLGTNRGGIQSRYRRSWTSSARVRWLFVPVRFRWVLAQLRSRWGWVPTVDALSLKYLKGNQFESGYGIDPHYSGISLPLDSHISTPHMHAFYSPQGRTEPKTLLWSSYGNLVAAITEHSPIGTGNGPFFLCIILFFVFNNLCETDYLIGCW
jgi:hypothetical protein